MPVNGLENIKYLHVPIDEGKSFFFDSVHVFWYDQVSFHQHVEWELSYIITGSGTRVVGDVIQKFSRGEIVLIPPNMPHCWSFDEHDHDEHAKIRNITICFPRSLIQTCVDNFPELKSACVGIATYTEAIRFEGITLRKLQKIFMEMPAQTDVQKLTSFISMLSIISTSNDKKVVGHSKQVSKTSTKMREIHRFILNKYQDSITLDDVANHVGMNRSSLCVFFKRVQGKSLITYLNEFRIESSCLMLRETASSIANICHAVGFNDVPYYNRLFKKMKGITPNEYRRISNSDRRQMETLE